MFASSKKLLATGPVLADVLAEYVQNFSPINITVSERPLDTPGLVRVDEGGRRRGRCQNLGSADETGANLR